jgi:hypothetical protein
MHYLGARTGHRQYLPLVGSILGDMSSPSAITLFCTLKSQTTY